MGRGGGSRALTAGRLLALAGCLAAAGCERVVDVDIPDPVPRLVVEGRIERIKGAPSDAPSGRQRIRLSTTAGFFDSRPTPPATGAIVTVVDGAGRAYSFPELEPGLYGTEHLFASVGETYTLFLEYRGDVYEASALLGEVPLIDSLYFVYEEETLFIDEEGYRAAIDFADPAGVPNYYLWEQLVEGVNEIPPDPGNAINLVSRDELYDGQDVVGFQPNDEIAIAPGEHAEIRQISLSRLGYDYYYALFEQNALGSANPFSIPPATIRGNVVNLDRPHRFAFGFFGAAEVSIAEGIAPAR
ncbi:MAG: DUF4249 domain-containing protein [Gemmatimonadota bacterium]|uniref:DUF4249 domain-containing protein n=1 Tax=Candidatus Palauibacter scopulicola TaxID=3056741 RepID=UPI00239DF495|nr:DUF4249 domain-containing protein [Candidatus Palauibacter scopulicola]MDE2664238.1 DUF4249 domain-containing protein [Candidatus Palauibacter scopulicola]